MLEVSEFAQSSFSEAESALAQLAEVFFPTGASTDSRPEDESQALLAETRYKLLLDQMTAVVFMVALDQGIGEAYVSPQIESMLGFTQAEWLEEPIRWYRQVHPEDKERWSIEAAQFFLAGEPLRSVYRVIARDGRTVWFQCEVKMVRHKDGRPWFIHGVGFDVSELKRTQQSLEAAVEAANAANRARNEFLANMSHEVRTPINGIMGMTQLAMETELTQEQREHLATIGSSADSLLSIVNDVLDFSKIESHSLILEIVEFRPRQCIEDAVRSLAGRAREKGIELAVDINSAAPENLAGDPRRLRQVLINLLDNAIKFTAAGVVTLRVETEAGAAGEVRLHFQVKDPGIGIPLDKQQMIFEPFCQVDSSSTRKYGGTGLGLAISTQLVTLMGGRLWVESEPGVGSTFHFTARFGAVAASSEVARVDAAAPSVLRILLAEDNLVNQKVAVRILQKQGHRVQTAENGLEALMALENGPFDVVLMDIQMPEMDGLQATTAIREMEKVTGEHLPIIALTAHAMNGDREICLAAGMDDYVTKPFKPKELFALLQAVARSRPSAQNLE